MKDKQEITLLIDVSEFSMEKLISVARRAKSLLEDSSIMECNDWLSDKKKRLLQITLQWKPWQELAIQNETASGVKRQIKEML